MSLSREETEILGKAIAHRRSMGLSRVSDKPVPKEVIESMLEAANWGQSNDDTEPWRFKVFMGDARNRLAEIYGKAYLADHPGDTADATAEKGYRDRAFLAPVWIAIGMEPGRDENGELVGEIGEELMAVATAVQNLSLMASAHGLAGMWHSRGVSLHPTVAAELGWTEPAKLLGFYFCGYANCDWPSGERKPIEEKVVWSN